MSESNTTAEISSGLITTETVVDEPVVQQLSVGQQLRAARLAAKLSITDVAQTVKFSPRQIELLERDQYDALPGMTIVRGFVRNYARMLKLDTEVLLKQLDATSPLMITDVRPPDNMGLAGMDGDRHTMGPMVSLAIVVLLAALMLAGWHFLGPKPVTSTHSANASVPAAASPSPVATLQAVPSEATNDSASTAAPVFPLPPGLNFVFEGRSWLEVADADAKVLHSAENPAGTQLSLSGKPPFDVVIGNATKVKLTYGERVIDLLPYTRADVARLKVE